LLLRPRFLSAYLKVHADLNRANPYQLRFQQFQEVRGFAVGACSGFYEIPRAIPSARMPG